MRRIIVFNQVSVDGYFAAGDGNLNWAHNNQDDAEWHAFITGNARRAAVMVFGRITYEMMASYWPSPQALETNPAVARGMNELPKIVFSRTLEKVSWQNAKLIQGDLLTEIRRMKQEPGDDMVILGSGSIVSQLAQAGLIDEYQIVVLPLVLGKGRSMFEGVKHELKMRLTKTRAFGNGNVLLLYEGA